MPAASGALSSGHPILEEKVSDDRTVDYEGPPPSTLTPARPSASPKFAGSIIKRNRQVFHGGLANGRSEPKTVLIRRACAGFQPIIQHAHASLGTLTRHPGE